jgi:predicted DNA-binding transcriptional regulator AlpA
MKTRMFASGGDPSTIPDEPSSFWRVPEVERRTGLSRASLYRLSNQGRFPKPIALSGVRPPAEQRPAA